MTLDLTFFAFAIPAVLFAGISKGGFGSGAAFAATPLLALILEPGMAVGLMLPLLMLMDLGGLKAFWREWDWAAAKPIIWGALPGLVLGAVFLEVAPPDLFRLLIGLVAVGFVAFQMSRGLGWIAPATKPMSDAAGYGWGFASGFTSFVSHAGGPTTAVYLLSQKMTKTSFQATTVVIFFVINLLKFPPYLYLGAFTRDSALANLFLAPFAFLGVWIGVILHRMMPEVWFFRLTYIFLTITGTKLIWDALI